MPRSEGRRPAAALILLVAAFAAAVPAQPADELTVATYNIRHTRGVDESVDLPRTAAAIHALGADVVALQEVDRLVDRSGRVDQPKMLGEALGMQHAFGAFFPYQGGEYGMAILSRFPIRREHALRLPDGNEPRVALFAELELPSGAHVLVVNVHLDWVADDTLRFKQVEALGAVLDTVSLPTILLGDFNDVPGSRTITRWAPTFAALAKPAAARFTFPSTGPEKEIDHIMVTPTSAWEGRDARVVVDPVTSDHRAVVGWVRLVQP
ncbi:MAG: endonuclease/exonuclease/phosphatase family protein [Longimicrobiales bacterium]